MFKLKKKVMERLLCCATACWPHVCVHISFLLRGIRYRNERTGVRTKKVLRCRHGQELRLPAVGVSAPTMFRVPLPVQEVVQCFLLASTLDGAQSNACQKLPFHFRADCARYQGRIPNPPPQQVRRQASGNTGVLYLNAQVTRDSLAPQSMSREACVCYRPLCRHFRTNAGALLVRRSVRMHVMHSAAESTTEVMPAVIGGRQGCSSRSHLGHARNPKKTSECVGSTL